MNALRPLVFCLIVLTFLSPCQQLWARPPLVVIDPGHGGKHLGARSKRHSFEEKQFTLPVAKRVEELLKAYGYRTRLTRTSDVFVGLEQRAAFANEHHGDVFISIHFNSAPSNYDVHGIEVYFFGTSNPSTHSKEGRRLSQSVLKQVITQTGAKSRGIKSARFAVLRQTRMPAALIEGGFLTNAKERARIKNSAYLEKIARGIAAGIHNYLSRN